MIFNDFSQAHFFFFSFYSFVLSSEFPLLPPTISLKLFFFFFFFLKEKGRKGGSEGRKRKRKGKRWKKKERKEEKEKKGRKEGRKNFMILKYTCSVNLLFSQCLAIIILHCAGNLHRSFHEMSLAVSQTSASTFSL